MKITVALSLIVLLICIISIFTDSSRRSKKLKEFRQAFEKAKADDIWDEDLARRMCRAVGGDVSFWMRRSLEHERMKLRLKMDELMEKTQEMLEIMEGAKNAR